MGRNADRLLTGCGVDHQQRLLRLKKSFQLLEFFYQRDIDFLAAGRVENVDVAARPFMPLQRCSRRPRDVFLVRVRFEDRDLDLFAEGCELIDRRRTFQVQSDQIWTSSLLLEQTGQLGGRSCLAGTVESDNQNSMRFIEI